MSRRLNFGIALLHDPKLVILDEPTVGIDPQSRSNLLDCVRELSRRGVGVLYASHYMEEVEAVCHRVAIIDHGQLLQQGTLDELLDRTGVELFVKVASLPPELQNKLRGSADIRVGEDGTTKILIRETVQQNSEVHPQRLLSVLEILEKAGVPLLDVGNGEWKCPNTGEMYIETDGRLRPAGETQEEN